MDKKITNYDNILNPNEALREYLKNLMPLYIDDYGKKNLGMINSRIKKTIYIFDSLPTVELDYLLKHESIAGIYKEKTERIFREAEDFLNKEKLITEKFDLKFYNILASYFGIENRYIDELFMLDIDSYSQENQIVLGIEEVDEEVKEEIRKRQEKYRHDCCKLNVKCLTDARIIEKIFEARANYDYLINLYLVKHTKWAKRLKRRIEVESGMSISFECLTELLFSSSTAFCSIVDVCKGEQLRICYFPIIENTTVGNLDGLFFHENRHAIEMGDGYSGLNDFSNKRYCTINEIRTEKNAIRDKRALSNNVLFSNEGYTEGSWNVYEAIFPYSGGFFDKYLDELNRLAVENNIKAFEGMFGCKNLRLFNSYLNTIQKVFNEEYLAYQEMSFLRNHKDLVKRINHYCETRHRPDNLV